MKVDGSKKTKRVKQESRRAAVYSFWGEWTYVLMMITLFKDYIQKIEILYYKMNAK
jgi:hypothetical protein